MERPEKLETPYDKNGLVIFPLSLECPKDKTCRLKQIGCTPNDEHHKYFWRSTYETDGPDSLSFMLRNCPFNIVSISRCVHIKYEELYLPPPIPSDSVMEKLLTEAVVLRRLGDIAIDLARHKNRYTKEEYDAGYEEIKKLGLEVMHFAMLPKDAIANPYDYIYRNAGKTKKKRALHLIHTAIDLDSLAVAA